MMMDDAVQIQLQVLMDELKSYQMRTERAERRIQMLTDAFVVSGLWRTSSSLDKWIPEDPEYDK
jgi:hypothetical protein